jgi:hypothetical protein
MEAAVECPVIGVAKASNRQRDKFRTRTKPQLLVRAELDGRTNAAKAFDRLVGEIIADLGGREACTALELNLIEAYVGAAIQVEALNCRQLLGETIDLTAYCQVASTMTRIASRLGLRRRPREVTPTLQSYLDGLAAVDKPDDADAGARISEAAE